MSEQQTHNAKTNNQQQSAKVFFISLLCFSAVIYLLFGQSSSGYNQQLTQEVSELASFISQQQWNNIVDDTNSSYRSLDESWNFTEVIGNAFLVRSNSGFLLPAIQEKSTVSEVGERLANNLKLAIYQVIFRLNTFQMWLLTFIPLLLASVVDGYLMWRAKSYKFGGISANKFRLWLRTLVIALSCIVVFIFIPGFLSSYAIYTPPIVLAAITYLVNRALCNYNKHV